MRDSKEKKSKEKERKEKQFVLMNMLIDGVLLTREYLTSSAEKT
jgi:hypothetical protein